MVPFANIDIDFAKSQLELFLREWYMHPNGQVSRKYLVSCGCRERTNRRKYDFSEMPFFCYLFLNLVEFYLVIAVKDNMVEIFCQVTFPFPSISTLVLSYLHE